MKLGEAITVDSQLAEPSRKHPEKAAEELLSLGRLLLLRSVPVDPSRSNPPLLSA